VSKAELEEGKELYLEACAICHGTYGDGVGVAAPALRLKPKPIALWVTQYNAFKLRFFVEDSADHPRFPSTLNYSAVLLYSDNEN
jgi:mono/diheme cytochrome c family protein